MKLVGGKMQTRSKVRCFMLFLPVSVGDGPPGVHLSNPPVYELRLKAASGAAET